MSTDQPSDPPEHDSLAPEDDEQPGLTRRLGRMAGSLSNAVLEGIDPDDIVARIDVDALVARIDPADVMARIDPNELLERVDVNALLDRVDVNELLDRVEVDRLLDQVDVNRLLDRVDVDRLLDRADIDRLLERADLSEIVAASTGQVAGSTIDLVRRQAVGIDAVITNGFLKLRGREPSDVPAGPSSLVGGTTGTVRTPSLNAPRGTARYEVTGHYAGLLTRLAANAGDAAAAIGSFTGFTAGLAYIIAFVFGFEIGADQSGPLWLGSLLLWSFFYLFISLTVAGRTPAMTLLGLRVVARDGTPLSPRRSFVRVITLPLSVLPFGAGFLGILFDRERRTLHDRLAGSVVVYDWGDRSARMPTPLGRWLDDRDEAPDPSA